MKRVDGGGSAHLSLREQYWQRVEELMAFTDTPQEDWPEKWMEVALEGKLNPQSWKTTHGSRWKSLIKLVMKKRDERRESETWAGRHSSNLSENEVDARRAALDEGTGRRTCPRCGEEFLNLRRHLTVC